MFDFGIFRNKPDESQKYREQIAKLERQNIELQHYYERSSKMSLESYERALGQKDSINRALADENRDLVRQLELYKAVLAQLSIPVKLPVRKPNG